MTNFYGYLHLNFDPVAICYYTQLTICYCVLEGAKQLNHVKRGGFPLRFWGYFSCSPWKAIRAAAGAHAVRILQDELPEALKRRQDQQEDFRLVGGRSRVLDWRSHAGFKELLFILGMCFATHFRGWSCNNLWVYDWYEVIYRNNETYICNYI